MVDSKNTSEKSNREPAKGEPAYIRYLPPYIMEARKGGVVKKPRTGKNVGIARNTTLEKASGSIARHKII